MPWGERWVGLGLTLLAALGSTSCSSELASPEPTASTQAITHPERAVLRLRLDNCRQGIGNRATAASIGDGLALTVAHSFDEVDGFDVTDAAGTTAPGELVFVDRDRDIAVIAFDDDELSLAVRQGLPLGTDATSEQLTIAYHREEGVFTATADVLRRVNASLDGVGQRAAMELAADIQPGDSGAPVVDGDGSIVGLVFASSRVGERGWAVAVSELIDAVDGVGDPLELTCDEG